MRNLLLLALLTALTACADGQGGFNGGTCGLKLAGDVPIEFRNNRAMANVETAGGHALFLIDTGAMVSLLRQPAVDALRLSVVEGGAYQLHGANGAMSGKVAVFTGASLGPMRLPEMRLPVAPDQEAGVAGEVVGILGMDVMSKYEIDFDVPARRIRFYAGTPCAGEATPLGAGAVDIHGTWTTHPNLAKWDPRLYLRGTIEGHDMSAMLDSGAQRSILNADMAPGFGITPGILAKDPATMVRGIGTTMVRAPRHKIAELRIGPTLLKDWEVWVIPRVYRGDIEDTSAMIIGMDYLQNHRIWMDRGRDVLLVQATP